MRNSLGTQKRNFSLVSTVIVLFVGLLIYQAYKKYNQDKFDAEMRVAIAERKQAQKETELSRKISYGTKSANTDSIISEINKEKKHNINWPPIAGATLLVGGVACLLLDKMK